MRAYQESQTLGAHWPQPTQDVMHQAIRDEAILPEPQQGLAIFEDFEVQMAAFAADHESTLNDIRKDFVLPADSSVVTFVNEHRTLPQILLEAAIQLKACFGHETVFSLRAPIDDSGSRMLYAIVMWPGQIQAVRDALRRFDDTWWIAHSQQASGHLTFTYELV